jgi:HlyD family secretion protein
MNSPKPSLDDLRIERRPEPRPRALWWWGGIGLVILLLAGGGAWFSRRADAIEVRTAVARPVAGGTETVLNASGYVTARREATVSSKVTGKVVAVLFEEGMRVTNGQVLARLDDSNVRASLAVAQAQLASAQAALAETEAQLKEANLELQRTRELTRQHIASPADLDLAQANPTPWPPIWRSKNWTWSWPNARSLRGGSNWTT